MKKKRPTKPRVATIRRTVEEQEILPEDFSAPAEPLEEEAEFDFTSLSDGLSVRVDKETPKGWEFCFQRDTNAINLEAIREEHGAGRFRIRGFKGRELVEEGFVLIAAKLAQANGEPIVVGPSSADRQFSQMQAMYDQQFKMMSEIVRGALAREPAERMPFSDVIQMAQMLAGNNKEGLSGDKVIEILLKGMELGRDAGGKEPESLTSQLLKAVSDIAPAFIGGGQRQLAAENPPAESSSVQQETMLRSGFDFLKKKSAQGSHPDLYLTLILDNGETPLYQSLIKWVCETSWEDVLKFDPEVAAPHHAKFFKAIYDGLRSHFGLKNSMAADSRRKGRNAANAATHEGVSSPGDSARIGSDPKQTH